MANHQRKLVLARMDEVFSTAAKERSQREDFVRDPHDTLSVPVWVLYEREKMHEAVNAERAALGLDPVSVLEVIKVENCAKGHVDYQRKFVLYCTELVFGDWGGP